MLRRENMGTKGVQDQFSLMSGETHLKQNYKQVSLERKILKGNFIGIM